MKYRRFGRTEMMLSQMTLGCMQFTGDWPEDLAIQTVVEGVRRGINHIETARGYGNSEERVGKALKLLPRDSYYITTKIGPSSDVEEFKRNFDTSQSLLGVDCIDNLDFHGPGDLESIRSAMTSDGCLGHVRRLQDEGRLKHFGFSTHGYPKGVMALVNTNEFDSLNLHYYYFYQGLRDIVTRATELDMGVFIISPSAQGGHLHHPTPALEAACAPLHPVTFNQLWLLNQPEVHTLSCGPKQPSDLDRNLAAADYDGTGPLRETFDRAFAQVEAHYHEALGNSYCNVCNACLPCPEEINIPGLLNLRNISRAFDMLGYTKERYSRVGAGGAWVLGVKGDQCTKCGDCLPRCPVNLPIPELLWDGHVLMDTGEIRPPRWQHEGDLLETSLKQSL